MLEAYRAHVQERAELNIPAKPLTAGQVAELVELLKNPPEGEAEFLLELLSTRVPPGVDEAAYVKAGFLVSDKPARLIVAETMAERDRIAGELEEARRAFAAPAATIDGLRVDWPDGWGLVRASNTTPILVLRFEADNQEALQRIQGAFRTRLLQLKPDLVRPV